MVRECASSTLPLVLDSLPPELSPLHGHGLATLQRGRAPELVMWESQRSQSGSPSRLGSEPSSRQPGSRGFRALACSAVLVATSEPAVKVGALPLKLACPPRGQGLQCPRTCGLTAREGGTRGPRDADDLQGLGLAHPAPGHTTGDHPTRNQQRETPTLLFN